MTQQTKQSEIALQNARRVLEEVFQRSHANHETHLQPNEYFEVFVSELILRNRSLCRKLLLQGRLRGGGDGGIDSLYVFVDDDWVDEENKSEIINRNTVSQIDIYLVQAKNSEKWDADAIHRLNPFARDLLDPGKTLPTSNETYNRCVLRICETFRAIYVAKSPHSPTINLRFYYASKGGDVHPNFYHWREDFRRTVGELANGYTCHFEFLGASELVELSRKPFPRDYCLHVEGEPLRAWDSSSYVVLANLKKYAEFISDSNGNLEPALFEANVRDWEGKNKVNLQIRRSLEDSPDEEFWWLNNGVTILAASANYDGPYLRLNNPEIVNGLQTSRTIHEFFSEEHNCLEEKRRLLLRIIIMSEGDEYDRRREVIRATNSHTAVKDAEIRSLDAIHYLIEIALNGYNPPVHYERRKKYYRNLRPRVRSSQIITVSRLTQSVIAVLLYRPDDAKARPGDYLQPDNQDKYLSVFNREYPYELYFYCAMLFLRVDSLLKSDERPTRPSRNVRLSLRYHVMTHVALMYGDSKRDAFIKRASRIAELDVNDITDFHISDSVSIVLQLYLSINRQQGKIPWKEFESELLKGVDHYQKQRAQADTDHVTHVNQGSS